MSEIRDHERSLPCSRKALAAPGRSRVFSLRGLGWDRLDGVFAPPYAASAGVRGPMAVRDDADPTWDFARLLLRPEPARQG